MIVDLSLEHLCEQKKICDVIHELKMKLKSYMIVDLSLDDLCEDEQLLVDAAVAQVVVTEEAVEPVVTMILQLKKNIFKIMYFYCVFVLIYLDR